MKIIQKILLLSCLLLIAACNGKVNQAENQNPPPREGDRADKPRDGKPSFDDLLSMMDKDKDGKISETEAEGPLKHDFSRADKNGDGFLTEDEMSRRPGGRPGGRTSRKGGNTKPITVPKDAETKNIHPAFKEFNPEGVIVYLDDNVYVIGSDGKPNHSSPYWSSTNDRSIISPEGRPHATPAVEKDHPLFIMPTKTSFDHMAPGNIDDFNGYYTLRVPKNPQIAKSSTATGMGPIGIAVSGSMIYNEKEGPGLPIDHALPSLDYNGAHTGPQSYHYHLEPKTWSDDDDKLIGIISDGFFLYGRKCHSTGKYPTDLDESGGHTCATQHNAEGEYHYHIQNELYLNEYYILFPDDYQGTPNAIK